MGSTTFSGPVISQNGFIGAITGAVDATTVSASGIISTAQGFRAGTDAAPIVVAAAANVSSSYVTGNHTTGDVRLNYSRLTVANTGSGETGRWLTRVTGANAATGGTVNGGHISLSINGSGTVSGAGNALRVTLGGSSTNPGGTLAALQLDSDFASGGSWTGATFLRCTNSGTGEISAFARLPNPGVGKMFAAVVGVPSQTHSLKVLDAAGNVYYLMATTTA